MPQSTMVEGVWTIETVREHLRSTAEGGVASAVVFFDGEVPEDKLIPEAQAAIAKIIEIYGGNSCVTVGRRYPLSKSVSVKGDPHIIAELLTVPVVRAVIPSVIADAYPKPVSFRAEH